MTSLSNMPKQPEHPRYYVETYTLSKQIHHGLWFTHPNTELGWKGRRHTYHRIILIPYDMLGRTLDEYIRFYNHPGHDTETITY